MVMDQKVDGVFRGKVVSLALDGWTSTVSDKVVNFLAIVEGRTYFMDSCIIEKADKRTLLNLLTKVLPFICSWLLIKAHLRVKSNGGYTISVVTDNGANMLAATKEFAEARKLPRVKCAAHTLQLFLRDLTDVHDLALVKRTQRSIEEVLAIFDDTQLRRRLLESQKYGDGMGGGTETAAPVRLISVCKTRWSTYVLAGRSCLFFFWPISHQAVDAFAAAPGVLVSPVRSNSFRGGSLVQHVARLP
jgi:hypothetical protein